MKLKFFILLVILVTNTFIISSQNKSVHDKIDSLILALYNNNQFSGQILVGTLDSVIYAKSYGWANKEKGQKLTNTTPTRLASVSKSVTAMAVMQLHEQGIINIYKPIKTYLPEVPYDDITAASLLTHTSGFPHINGKYMGKLYKVSNPLYGDVTNDGLLKFLELKKPKRNYELGEKFFYLNSGYSLLASLIERVSKKSFNNYLKENIFDPLGMDSSFVLSKETFNEHDIAFSYKYKKSKIVKDLYYTEKRKDGERIPESILYGDKHIFSCIEDMYSLDTAFFKYQLHSKKIVDEILTPVKPKTIGENDLKYGYGWYLQEQTGAWHHTGGIEHYATLNYVDVKENLVVIVLGNRLIGPLYGLVGGPHRIIKGKPIEKYYQMKSEIKSFDVFEKTFKIDY